MKRLNIWDMERANIKLNESFLKEVNEEISLKFKSKKKFYSFLFKNNDMPFSTFKDLLKISHNKNYFSPLWIYLRIIYALNISKEHLQSNILSYKTAGGVNIIEKPKLPIIINPVFDMLLAHHFGDGFVTNPLKGRLPYLGYKQFNDFYRLNYIKKIEFVFGKIHYATNYFMKSTQLYCPAVLSSVFFKHYNLKVEDFLTEKARIPKIVFENGKESMLAFLIAFIIDEGNIDSTQITIHLKNLGLIEDLKKICDNFDYNSKITISKKESHHYVRLHILREGMKIFYQDYLLLNKRYPIIDLGIKGEKIKNSFKIYTRKIYKTKGNQGIIFEILKKENLSVNQLADRINMTRQGTRFHIHNLLNEGKIRILDKNQLNWIYGV